MPIIKTLSNIQVLLFALIILTFILKIEFFLVLSLALLASVELEFF